MAQEWQYQIRLELADASARMARLEPANPALESLSRVLRKHGATLQCQFDAFAAYVAEAERLGTEKFPLYAWTRATIENPVKEAKYLKSFALHVEGDAIYAREKADALEAAAAAPGGRAHRGVDVEARLEPGEQSAAAEALSP